MNSLKRHLILGVCIQLRVSDQVLGGFYPSTQRHYRSLIYYYKYIILLHVSVVRPSSGREYINS
jgi:hypothetical protein